jgi:hypothetical protein
MAGSSTAVEVYTGRLAVAQAHAFIETLDPDNFLAVTGWSEAETPTIMVVYKVTL